MADEGVRTTGYDQGDRVKTKVGQMQTATLLGIGCLGLLLSPLSAQEPTLRNTLKGHNTNDVYTVAFSPDGKTLASGNLDETIRLWDVATGKEQATLNGHTSLVFSVAFGPDGKTLASGSMDTTIK